MWQRQMHDAFHHGKHHAVKWAGQIDHAMNVGKRVFGALHPATENIGGSHVNRAVMQGISGYERGRNEIMGHHNNVQATLSCLGRKRIPRRFARCSKRTKAMPQTTCRGQLAVPIRRVLERDLRMLWRRGVLRSLRFNHHVWCFPHRPR